MGKFYWSCLKFLHARRARAHKLSCNIGGLEEPYAEIHHRTQHTGCRGALDRQQLAAITAGVMQRAQDIWSPQIQWLESYVTDDKVYCVYIAPDEATIREHARLGQFPADSVQVVRSVIDPHLRVDSLDSNRTEAFIQRNPVQARKDQAACSLKACTFAFSAGIRKNQSKYGPTELRQVPAPDVQTTLMLADYPGGNPQAEARTS